MVTSQPEDDDDTHEHDVKQLVGAVEELGADGTVGVEIGDQPNGADKTTEDE